MYPNRTLVKPETQVMNLIDLTADDVPQVKAETVSSSSSASTFSSSKQPIVIDLENDDAFVKREAAENIVEIDDNSVYSNETVDESEDNNDVDDIEYNNVYPREFPREYPRQHPREYHQAYPRAAPPRIQPRADVRPDRARMVQRRPWKPKKEKRTTAKKKTAKKAEKREYGGRGGGSSSISRVKQEKKFLVKSEPKVHIKSEAPKAYIKAEKH